MRTLQDLLDTFAGNSSPAITIPSKNALDLSYHTLFEQVAALKSELGSLGVSVGSRLSIILPNSFEFVTLFLATTCIRATAIPHNPALKQVEYEYSLKLLDPALVIVAKGAVSERHAAVLAALDMGITIIECSFYECQVVLRCKYGGCSRIEATKMPERPAEQDVAVIMNTSGTTGRPKAVPLTHRNILASMTNVCATYNLNRYDRTILIIPIFHIHGLIAGTLSSLYSGGTTIIPTRLSPSFWTDLVTYKVTWYTGTPTTHVIVLQLPRTTLTPPGLRFIRSGSSPLLPSLQQKLESAFAVPVLNNYGMTEACGQITSDLLPPALKKPGSIGMAIGVEVLVLDEQSRPVPLGTEGEICVRGPGITSGYLDEAADAESFTTDRFFRTGDYGRCDKDGYLFLSGRLKELVNKGGEKISLAELDTLITQHPAVHEAATFAVKDVMYGQNLSVAVRVVKGDMVDAVGLRKWFRERVAPYKVPEEIFFVTEFPKTATGKVRRDVLAEVLVKKAGLMPKL